MTADSGRGGDSPWLTEARRRLSGRPGDAVSRGAVQIDRDRLDDYARG